MLAGFIAHLVTRRSRMLVEIMVPAPLGTFLWITWHFTVFRHRGELGPEFVLPDIFLAYVFAIVPSCIYAVLLEFSLRRHWWRRFGLVGFVGYSAGLGTLAGIAIWRASRVQVVGIGAVVGLILALMLYQAVPRPAGSALPPPEALP